MLPWDDDFDLAVDAADHKKLNRELKRVVSMPADLIFRARVLGMLHARSGRIGKREQ